MAARRHRCLVTLGLTVPLLIAACTSAGPAGPPAEPATSSPLPAQPDPTPVPVPSVDGLLRGDGSVAPGGGGGSLPDPGTGIGDPPLQPAEPPVDPQPSLVTPVAGVTDFHPVPATALSATVDGRRVSARPAWWSGVEPCNVLAAVDVVRDGNTFLLTVLEGSANVGQVACIEIAAYKATEVDLGELEPGEYTITAFGDPTPVVVSVPG